MTRMLVAILVLVPIYLLVLGSFQLGDIAVGIVLASVLVIGLREMIFGERAAPLSNLPRRLLAFFPFVLVVAWDVVKGTGLVVSSVLGLRPLQQPGIVEVPIGERTTTGVAILALVTTLSPGSYLVDIDQERRVMLFHMLDARDPDGTREEYQRFYQRYQRPVFP